MCSLASGFGVTDTLCVIRKDLDCISHGPNALFSMVLPRSGIGADFTKGAGGLPPLAGAGPGDTVLLGIGVKKKLFSDQKNIIPGSKSNFHGSKKIKA